MRKHPLNLSLSNGYRESKTHLPDSSVVETIHPDDITLGVRWTFRFAGGLKFPFDIPLVFNHERAAPCQMCASDDT